MAENEFAMTLFVTATLIGDVRYETDTHNDAQKFRRDDISVEKIGFQTPLP
jgi:hypothetical protein